MEPKRSLAKILDLLMLSWRRVNHVLLFQMLRWKTSEKLLGVRLIGIRSTEAH